MRPSPKHSISRCSQNFDSEWGSVRQIELHQQDRQPLPTSVSQRNLQFTIATARILRVNFRVSIFTLETKIGIDLMNRRRTRIRLTFLFFGSWCSASYTFTQVNSHPWHKRALLS